uniref:Uncharacterized protein n=1 Tax=Setaria italica TaxID=4555 RepID=K4A7L6_SETIT
MKKIAISKKKLPKPLQLVPLLVADHFVLIPGRPDNDQHLGGCDGDALLSQLSPPLHHKPAFLLEDVAPLLRHLLLAPVGNDQHRLLLGRPPRQPAPVGQLDRDRLLRGRGDGAPSGHDGPARPRLVHLHDPEVDVRLGPPGRGLHGRDAVRLPHHRQQQHGGRLGDLAVLEPHHVDGGSRGGVVLALLHLLPGGLLPGALHLELKTRPGRLGGHDLQRAVELGDAVIHVDGLPRLAEAREGEAVPRGRAVEGLPSFVHRAAAREVLHGARQLPHALGLEAVVDGVLRGVGALARVEEAELVEQVGPAVGVEVGKQVGRERGRLAEERVADLGRDDEAVLLDAGDARGLLDGGRGEAVAGERGDEGRVLVPLAQALAKDLEALGEVEGAELGRKRGRRRVEGLVELARRSHRGRGEGELPVAAAARAAAAGEQDCARGDVAGAAAARRGGGRDGGAGRALVPRRRGGVRVRVGEGEHGGDKGGEAGEGGTETGRKRTTAAGRKPELIVIGLGLSCFPDVATVVGEPRQRGVGSVGPVSVRGCACGRLGWSVLCASTSTGDIKHGSGTERAQDPLGKNITQ